MATVSIGCVATGAAAAPVALKDAADRSVTVESGTTSIVPAGAPAQVLLHALAPGKLTGLVEPFAPEHMIYVDPRIAALPQIPMLTRTAAPGDVAAVAALKPGLVVDYGDVSARYVAADETIQSELSTPAAIFGGRLANAATVLKTLGGAVGEEARGSALADLVAKVLADAKPVSDLPEASRVGVYLARGQDGLTASRAGTSVDEPIRLAGGRNVVTGTGSTFKRMSVEDVVALKPRVVIFAEPDAFKSPLHAALPKGTTFVLDAGEPYKVLTGPPSLNRLVGLAALPAILHPGTIQADPAAVTRIETMLFAIPSGTPVPDPLQLKD